MPSKSKPKTRAEETGPMPVQRVEVIYENDGRTFRRTHALTSFSRSLPISRLVARHRWWTIGVGCLFQVARVKASFLLRDFSSASMLRMPRFDSFMHGRVVITASTCQLTVDFVNGQPTERSDTEKDREG